MADAFSKEDDVSASEVSANTHQKSEAGFAGTALFGGNFMDLT